MDQVVKTTSQNMLQVLCESGGVSLVHKSFRELTIENHVERMIKAGSENVQLSKLRKENEQDMEDAIRLLLSDLSDSLNMGEKGLNRTMIEELLIFIPQDYYWLHLEDIYLFCQQVKRGKFGVMYESLNTVKLMGYLKKYDEERVGLITNIRLKEHAQEKAQTPGGNIRNEDFDFQGTLRQALVKYNSGSDQTINPLPKDKKK